MVETASSTMTLTLPSDREIVLTRVFDAPRELVWKACTDPQAIPHWWGPRRHTTRVDRMHVWPGGGWRFVSRDADGNEFAFHGEYREVVPPERIVQTLEFEGMPGHVSVETMTLVERDGKTTLTTRSVFNSVEDRDGVLRSGMEAGVRETYDRLAEYLESMASGRATSHGALVIERVFDASRELVWKAWTQPEHVKRWWGPKGFSCPAAEIDFRVGGRVLMAMQSPEFNGDRPIWSTGVYREIVPLERIVCTDSFADEKGNVVPATYYGMNPDMPLEMVVTVTFEEHEGKTKLILRHEGIPAGEDLDGARQGWSESFDKLADHLAKM
jgi:uncharacterized protein YndB with AHSA1/START domain